jgi:hypothetical protein
MLERSNAHQDASTHRGRVHRGDPGLQRLATLGARGTTDQLLGKFRAH